MENKSRTLKELAEMVEGTFEGDPNLLIHGLSDIDSATRGEVTFVTSPKRSAQIATTGASAVIVPTGLEQADKPVIMVHDPNWAAAVIHNYFQMKPFVAEGISPSAHVGSDCSLPDEVTIGPMAVLGDRVLLGKRVVINPGTVIGDDVKIGEDSILHSNVTITNGCRIGSRVIIHSGTVIGSDGFGYATDKHGRHVKRPHVGIVQIDDDVEIGSNVSVDRATFGKTWIKQGVKIDNLVHIAHNVTVGEGSLLAGQVGLAGSSILGRGVMLGGQTGVADQTRVGNRVMAAGKTGIVQDVEDGVIVSGFPAMPHKQWLRASNAFSMLPDLVRDIRNLKKKVAEIFTAGHVSEEHEDK
ncbi:MAG: UDP-3-O-(3-hydroxymyristoyl)glucosamine N-acyltransferase [Desulfobulbaceae bacterium]|nr:UDP-3-O-(3-hydroxymyristoyl)glucosamine N-acyltransferase [Desulfobulbaceae bacterium]MCK5323409.1 UDP-3-O-(3-hydroxymyristoyl)glucosamine N-acyltransferase [Desulfobulbaceae bacterium]MCK5545187.1 UDP-3-O-(3-hydroxymyristoyl)glucosamine N-acyltransferase [Desulfobulbaceae bacterium]